MAFRWIPHDNRLNALLKCIELKNVKEVAKEYGIRESLIKEDFRDLLKEADEMLKKKKPGRKVKDAIKKVVSMFNPTNKTGREKNIDQECPNCSSKEISRNGTFPAINYMLLLLSFLLSSVGITPIYNVQKWMCKICNTSFTSSDQHKNIQLKNVIKTSIIRLIAILRFGEGMSVRGISNVVSNVFGMCYSIGFIDKVSQRISNNAAQKMNKLNECKQKEAKVLMFDETFPKAKDNGCLNLGVATCENGLIRKVGIIDTTNKSISLKDFFTSLITKHYKPSIFMSDYDTAYPTAIKTILPEITILKDFVHTIRQILRDTRSALNKVTVTFPVAAKLTKERQKEIVDLKKKLLRKRLYKIIRTIIKGFKSRNSAVGTIYIEGGLDDLRQFVHKFKSLEPFYNKLRKFTKKHIKTWNIHMELHSLEDIPLTSNLIESKNSILKSHSKKAKSYSNKWIEPHFCAIALYENFDVKTRGKNKGTNAMQRAGIDFEEFGACNFFDAVGISDLIKNNNFPELFNSINAVKFGL